MTAAVVAPLQVPSLSDVSVCDSSAEARKRRREILASQRSLVPDVVASVNPIPAPKKRKISTDETLAAPSSSTTSNTTTTTSKPAKKPQMKYDPDVPMTKEEAAVWRREQRRKRNRESAAASRQRQRDRINELESEVDDWKTQYEAIMAKIRELEQVTGSSSLEITEECPVSTSRPATPPPVAAQTVTPRASPTSTTSLVSLTDKISVKSEDVVTDEEQEEPPKMISQQALFRIIHTNFRCRAHLRNRPLTARSFILCLS